MKNYIAKIPLGENKFAYEQAPEFRESGLQYKARLENCWAAPDHYFHLRSGGHVAALVRHKKNTCFSKIDLSRFYYRVTKNKIIRSLKKAGISFAECREISAESVVRTETGFSLPYGFVQSPILSTISLHFSKLGKLISETPSDIMISVYVDDIVISSAGNHDLLEEFSRSLIEAARDSGFPENPQKTVLNSKQIETFNVNLSHEDLYITKERMDDFHRDLRTGPSDLKVMGILNYVEQINPTQRKELQATADRYASQGKS